MTTLYVVMGSHGEYSDRSEWMVAAYLDEQKGQEHVRRVGDALRSFLAIEREGRERVAEEAGDSAGQVAKHALDKSKGFYVWDYDQRYWLDTVELLDEVPT